MVGVCFFTSIIFEGGGTTIQSCLLTISSPECTVQKVTDREQFITKNVTILINQ